MTPISIYGILFTTILALTVAYSSSLQNNITAQFMHQQHFGPVIFREECVFKKEILPSDKVTVDVQLLKSRKDGSRWTMQHQILRTMK